ncbi:tRNA-splicing ligase RtcB family protein [Leishmania donovani]|nr:tRNA-splicing ligase RtcB family protein [Leishmania donovani]TPP55632.1 tRNA-splicing ligase RtcB family protein [Leishmania donovani]
MNEGRRHHADVPLAARDALEVPSKYEVISDPSSAVEVRVWRRGVEVERTANEQLHRISRMSPHIIPAPVAVMPDVHAGIGCTVGLVLPTVRAIIPACVGVDIGCGMIAVQTSLTAEDLPNSLEDLRLAIELGVPHGRTHGGYSGADAGSWRNSVPTNVQEVWKKHLADDFEELCRRHAQVANTNNLNHLGTLGTGNHFIELCLDDQQPRRHVWVMLHSGSRGVGNRIGSLFIELAKKDMEARMLHLPDADLAYLDEGTANFSDYIFAVEWAQRYAWWNRQLMLDAVLVAMRGCIATPFTTVQAAVNCHHNYVERIRIPIREQGHEGHAASNPRQGTFREQDVWLTRKGATSARMGELAVIPGSMGACSYIVRGKGSAASYCSCSHGAGRRYSRGEARRRFTVSDHEAATLGIECRKDSSVLDETPAAYKNIDAVMAAQDDLVEVVTILRQVLCVKG